MNMNEIVVGNTYRYDGILPIGDEVMVVKWDPIKWMSEGFTEGPVTRRPGMVPVYSDVFPDTALWWVAPHSLHEIEYEETRQ